MTATEPDVVAGQASAIAEAWSPPDAPESWWLTAATFAAIAREDVLRQLAAEIPIDRLPPLLLAAVLEYLIRADPALPIARHYPVPGGTQPPSDPGFGAELATFAAAHRDRVAQLCGQHRYQMNEVGRCVDVLPVLGMIAAEGRPLALVDLGTGAGLALHLDRYVFLPPSDLARFDDLLVALGRDVDWVSVDPLVPLGPQAQRTVQGLDVPPDWVQDNREEGVFGVIGHVRVRDGVRTGRVLGRAHPGAAWLEWTS